MGFLSIFRNTNTEIEILKNKINLLEKEIQLKEEYHLKEISFKDKEIDLLKQTIDLIKKDSLLPSTVAEKTDLSSREEFIYKKHLEHQTRNYEELSKLTNLSKENLRNFICRIKKKGWEFKFFI